VRLCAGLIDLGIVATPVVLTARVAASLGSYIPLEIVVLAVYAAYTIATIGSKGRTLGMAVLGIRVERRDGRAVRWGWAAMRAAGVFVSQCLLGLPFLVIGTRRSKRGLHDNLSGTVVVLQGGLETRRRRIVSVVLVFLAGWIVAHAVTPILLYQDHRRWIADAEAAADARAASPDQPVEVASVTAENLALMRTWLSEHGRDPRELVVDVAARHQATIAGEVHGRKQNLEFFKSLIPDLYSKAQVRVIALECCLADQNDELNELVNGEQFDSEKLKRIARGAIWQAWGYRQYWEVLEVVWQVNRSRPAGRPPLRVVGLWPRMDGPSFFLVMRGPMLEKLRLVRLIDDLPSVLLHDAHYTNCVEREAFEKGERTFVWVGAGHSSLNPFSIAGTDGRIVARLHRMGSMLAGRYEGQVGQVVIQSEFQHGAIARRIEECSQQCGRPAIAFVAADSPFASLRDSQAFGYFGRPLARFSDLVCHYVQLAPSDALEECDWLEGFFTRSMLGRNRPFYEWLAGSPIRDAEDGDRRIRNNIQRL